MRHYAKIAENLHSVGQLSQNIKFSVLINTIVLDFSVCCRDLTRMKKLESGVVKHNIVFYELFRISKYGK